MQRQQILGIYITPTTYERSCALIISWQEECVSHYICAANVHMIMTAFDNPEYKAMINAADMVTPDGMPLVWTLRMKGFPDQQRVYGPTLTQKLLPLLKQADTPIGFYGSSPEVLGKLQQAVRLRHLGINIAYAYSPPFREVTAQEDEKIVEEINRSGVRVLFVGLGCPKQEIWMHAHKGRIQAVMLGVGAAFDFIAGVKPQAPLWIQRIGMEWFYRLIAEPKRLWRRYLYYNPRFVVLVLKELIFSKRQKH